MQSEGPNVNGAVCCEMYSNVMKRTFRKYLVGVPSGRITETLAVFVHADTPDDSEETTFVPSGITVVVYRSC